MKKHPSTRALRRLSVIVGLAFAGITAVAQAPAGTAENPTAPMNCWPVVPCPPGTICGPGGGLGMSQKRGTTLPVGLASGGAYSSLVASGMPPIRRIDDNYQVPDLRLLAPTNLSGIVVTSATATLYRGGLLTDAVAEQASFNFASGSLRGHLHGHLADAGERLDHRLRLGLQLVLHRAGGGGQLDLERDLAAVDGQVLHEAQLHDVGVEIGVHHPGQGTEGGTFLEAHGVSLAGISRRLHIGAPAR